VKLFGIVVRPDSGAASLAECSRHPDVMHPDTKWRNDHRDANDSWSA
jgi:hypothetical protein